MKPIYIIPARGGSKGIPRKNIRPLGGVPLIGWTIAAARAAGAAPERIILSTDDAEIADTARSLGLPVEYMRPAELATDTAGSREMMLDVMDWADARGLDYDCVVLLQPTSPLRTSADIRAAIEAYSPDIDMAVTVTESKANPYYNLFESDPATGYLQISKGDGLLTRRQDAPKVWEYNGAVYVINPASLRSKQMGRFARRKAVVMDSLRSIDLDSPRDWQIAEAVVASNHFTPESF